MTPLSSKGTLALRLRAACLGRLREDLMRLFTVLTLAALVGLGTAAAFTFMPAPAHACSGGDC